jgi:hypothetical protein
MKFYRADKAADSYAYNIGWEYALKDPALSLKEAIKTDRQYRGWLGVDQKRWSAANRSYALGRIDSLNELRFNG